ncbi:hypothetical protein [Rhizobium laguerreae]|uniref:hypothetical protein n=1 Tax=Rhizobium laguerreae TaxID=1076926 RepID=UPI001C921B7D|nr:hypothetical protein [Rhizobium laguerreae]MBY3486165.1 hypothetical protein [Rhizobium laguerreae]
MDMMEKHMGLPGPEAMQGVGFKACHANLCSGLRQRHASKQNPKRQQFGEFPVGVGVIERRIEMSFIFAGWVGVRPPSKDMRPWAA